MEKVAIFHSDSSFKYYRNMGSGISSNNDFKKIMPQYMDVIRSWKMEVSNPVVQVLDKNVAVIGLSERLK